MERMGHMRITQASLTDERRFILNHPNLSPMFHRLIPPLILLLASVPSSYPVYPRPYYHVYDHISFYLFLLADNNRQRESVDESQQCHPGVPKHMDHRGSEQVASAVEDDGESEPCRSLIHDSETDGDDHAL